MHITVAGRLGSGKSTVCGILSKHYGFEVFSTGAIQRRLAAERNVTTLEMNKLMEKEKHLDHLIDTSVAKLSSEENHRTMLFDSRMAWHFAVNAYKVYITVDPLVAARRVFNDSRGKVEIYHDILDARNKLAARSDLEKQRFNKIYGVDTSDYTNYDLIIDSTFSNPEALASKIYEKFSSFTKLPSNIPELLISPSCLYPLTTLGSLSGDNETLSAPIAVFPCDGYHYITDGIPKWLASSRCGNEFITADLSQPPANAEELKTLLASLPESTLEAYEKVGSFTYPSIPMHYQYQPCS